MKNNQLFFYILLFFSINNSYSQTQPSELEFIYSFRRNNFFSISSLKFDNNYQIWEEIEDMKPIPEANVANYSAPANYHRLNVYKSNKDSTILSDIDVFFRLFYIKESTNLFNWEILDSTANVLGKKCGIAKTQFKGRTYHAFYTEEFPVPYGPWKFNGLPGLILKVETIDNELDYYEIKCIQIVKNTKKHNLEKIYSKFLNKNKKKFLSWENFKIKIDVLVDRVIKFQQITEEDEDIQGNDGLRLINYLEIFHLCQKEKIRY